MPVFGEARADGYRFNGMCSGREHWISPATWEKKRERMADWSKRNRQAVKADPLLLEKARKKAREHMHRNRRADPVLHMLIRSRARAKARGLEFAIGREHVSIPAVCPVLGIPLRIADGLSDDSSPELDRIENARGYVPGNVVVISRRANRIKNDATIAELVRVAAFYSALTAPSQGLDPAPGS